MIQKSRGICMYLLLGGMWLANNVHQMDIEPALEAYRAAKFHQWRAMNL